VPTTIVALRQTHGVVHCLNDRYFDDVHATVLTTDKTGQVTLEIWQKISDTYHAQMEMEQTNTSGDNYKFLLYDGHVATDRRSLSATPHNPNAKAVKERGCQQIYRFTHYDSPCQEVHKYSTLVTVLLQTHRSAHTSKHFLKAAHILLNEFVVLRNK
jgi:hypothetical protein